MHAYGTDGTGTNLMGIASGGEEARKTGRALLEEIVPGLSRAAVFCDPHSGPVAHCVMGDV
jgi:hypothetical protein